MTDKQIEVVKENSLLSIIERAAMNPDVDVLKLEKMLDMQERVMNKQAEIEFNQSMARLQPRIPAIKKTAEGHKIKYARYEDIDRVVRPLYTDEGFSISFDQRKCEDSSTEYTATLSHVDGHYRTANISLPDDDTGHKNAVQARGSTTSYAKRYLISMLFNIVTEDEDNDAQLYGCISDDLVKEIEDLMETSKSNKGKFFAFMGVAEVSQIQQQHYLKAKNVLTARIKKNGDN